MNVLLVAATEAEIGPFCQYFKNKSAFSSGVNSGDILITGVGMVATTYALTRQPDKPKYDLILQAGVGGSFDPNIPLGEVVLITSEQFGDLGAEDHENFLDIFELGLANKDGYPFAGGKLPAPILPVHDKIKLRKAKGITINTVSGSEQTIAQRVKKYGYAVESMEGAAFHYVCLQERLPFMQVRAISNYVTPRDKSQWKMKEAIVNLNNWLIHFLETL